jgi:hypothetical protein
MVTLIWVGGIILILGAMVSMWPERAPAPQRTAVPLREALPSEA